MTQVPATVVTWEYVGSNVSRRGVQTLALPGSAMDDIFGQVRVLSCSAGNCRLARAPEVPRTMGHMYANTGSDDDAPTLAVADELPVDPPCPRVHTILHVDYVTRRRGRLPTPPVRIPGYTLPRMYHWGVKCRPEIATMDAVEDGRRLASVGANWELDGNGYVFICAVASGYQEPTARKSLRSSKIKLDLPLHVLLCLITDYAEFAATRRVPVLIACCKQVTLSLFFAHAEPAISVDPAALARKATILAPVVTTLSSSTFATIEELIPQAEADRLTERRAKEAARVRAKNERKRKADAAHVKILSKKRPVPLKSSGITLIKRGDVTPRRSRHAASRKRWQPPTPLNSRGSKRRHGNEPARRLPSRRPATRLRPTRPLPQCPPAS